jgi:hypothetical protein
MMTTECSMTFRSNGIGNGAGFLSAPHLEDTTLWQQTPEI